MEKKEDRGLSGFAIYQNESTRMGNTCIYLWWIHFDIWQNQYNIVKLKNKIKFKKKRKKKKKETK